MSAILRRDFHSLYIPWGNSRVSPVLLTCLVKTAQSQSMRGNCSVGLDCAGEENRPLIADAFPAATYEEWPGRGSCPVILAVAGRRASHAGVFWQHASRDRSAAAAGRVANQERQRIERSEVIPSGEVSAARQVGGEKHTNQVSQTAKRVATRPEGVVDLMDLPREGSWRMVSRRDRVKFGNSG